MLHVPNGFAQVLIRLSLTGDPEEMASTIGVEAAAGADAQDISDAVDTALQAVDAPFEDATRLITGWTYAGVTARLETASGQLVGETFAGLAGTTVGSTLPQNCTYLLRKQTGVGGRANQGRMYLPMYGSAESDVSNAGVINSASVTALNDRWTEFLALGVASAAIEAFVLFHTETAPGVGPTPTEITSLVMDNTIATQRRRLRH